MTETCRQQLHRLSTGPQTCNHHLHDAVILIAAARLSIAKATGQIDEGEKQTLARIMTDLRLDLCAVESILRSRLFHIEQVEQPAAKAVLP
jgi:hypothetical protein